MKENARGNGRKIDKNLSDGNSIIFHQVAQIIQSFQFKYVADFCYD